MYPFERNLAKWTVLGLFAAALAVPAACQAQQIQQQFGPGLTSQVTVTRRIVSQPPVTSPPSFSVSAPYRPTYTQPTYTPPAYGGAASWGGYGPAWPSLPLAGSGFGYAPQYQQPSGGYYHGNNGNYGGNYGGYVPPTWSGGGQVFQNNTFTPPAQEIPDAQAYVAPPAQNPAPIRVGESANVTVYPRREIFTPNPGERRHHFRGGYSYPYYGDGSGYPTAYSYYPGFPDVIDTPGAVISYSPPVEMGYVGNYIPFSAPDFNNADIESLYQYYDIASESPFQYHGPAGPVYPSWVTPPAAQQAAPSEQPQPAPEQPQAQPSAEPNAPGYPSGSYKEAFADIQSAWNNGDIDPINKHLKSDSTKVAVSLSGKYAYSIASSDWADITRDAFDHLQTVSFEFTVLRFQKNGDITGYATHVYTGKSGQNETMYVSYTLRHRDGQWYVIGVNTSPKPIIDEQAKASDTNQLSSSDSSSSPSSGNDSSSSDSDKSRSGNINISN